jgi:uncharacterized membrane protein YidH (DUF202 family)
MAGQKPDVEGTKLTRPQRGRLPAAAAVGVAGITGTGGIGVFAFQVVTHAFETFKQANEWLRLLALVASIGIVLIGLIVVAVGLGLAILRELSPIEASSPKLTAETFGLVLQAGIALVVVGTISMALVVIVA